MKRYLLYFLIVFLMFPGLIKADNCSLGSITIEEISIEETKGEAVEKSTPTIEGMNIKLDLKFTEVNDSIKYKITIKNNTEDVYEFKKDKLVSKSDYISYTFENGNYIDSNETKDIYLTIKYKSKIKTDSFENGVFSENKNIKNTLNLDDIVNPRTGVFDYEGLIYKILFVSLVIYFISSRKVAKKEYVVLLALMIIPITIYSACAIEMSVESNIEIEQFKDRTFYNISDDESKLDKDKSKYVTSNNGIDFKYPSSDTNGKGVYIVTSTKDDEYPIHYYRGDVKDNNVLFGGFCWKILRTTSTGGTKLVYNGVPDSENKCNNSGEDTLVATGIKYGSNGSAANFGYTYGSGHAYKSVKISGIANGSVFAEDVTYEDGKYILNDERYIKDGDLESTIDESLGNHHYSCFKDENGECTSVNFIYMNRGAYLYYIILSGGEKIDEALEKDLNPTTDNNSTIKTYVENWFSNNLTEYTSYLEDEVWCNDRSIGSLGGWGIHGNISESSDVSINDINKLRFAPLTRAKEGKPSLKCVKEADRYTTSTSTGNGKNAYPVGLITMDEAILAGFAWDKDDESTYLYNGKVWWGMSPTLNSVQLDYVGVFHSMADNVHTGYISGGSGGVRPSVSLNKNVKISGGDGTTDNPFTVKMQ